MEQRYCYPDSRLYHPGRYRDLRHHQSSHDNICSSRHILPHSRSDVMAAFRQKRRPTHSRSQLNQLKASPSPVIIPLTGKLFERIRNCNKAAKALTLKSLVDIKQCTKRRIIPEQIISQQGSIDLGLVIILKV